MRVLKYMGVAARTAAMLGIVAPALLYGVFAKEQPKSTLGASVARNAIDMMPVGGIGVPSGGDVKHLAKHTRRP